ncbi:MAG: DUF4169 family protein [Alphaproteobacteria bacterium]|nr:DUF4169 family protein [Alphaproteobacteria bacterium]
MAEIVNLKNRRKLAERAAKDAQAEQNRARFGRTKVEKQLDKAERERSLRDLDSKKLED